MKALKLASAGLAAAFVALLAVSIFATELTRLFVRRVAVSPLALPAGVDIRYSDRLVAIIGKGSGGTARAVTVGHVIVVRTTFDRLTDRERRRLIRHELAHVKQRTHYGRFYLPVYGIQYLRHGYRNHPLERAARRSEGASRPMIKAALLPASAALPLVALLLAGSNSEATDIGYLACSFAITPPQRAALYFVGTATSDTVLAGPGDIVPRAYDTGTSAPRRRVYGQLIRVALLNPDAPAELHQALSGSSPDVVVVPWTYDPACAPAYWSRSAQWSEPGSETFYVARPRPRQFWIDDRPTFDAMFLDPTPYPRGLYYQPASRGTTASDRSSLTAREFFALHSTLPSAVELRDAPASAYERLRAWERTNPEVSTRYPANEIIAASKQSGPRGR